MENQHRKISGYRELSQTEIDLMNKIKAKGVELKDLIQEITHHLAEQSGDARAESKNHPDYPYGNCEEDERLMEAQPTRWVASATTDLQTGLMALTRAVAQPTTF